MSKKISIVLIVIGLVACRQQGLKINIVPFSVLNRVDTIAHNGKNYLDKSDYFLVDGYQDTELNNRVIDNYIFNHVGKDYRIYGQYSIIVCRKSKKTNLNGNPDESSPIDRYSAPEDMLLEYIWHDGKFSSRHKYRDGAYIIDPKNKVKITDLK